ncbi:hypothetical protein [Flavobacterium psychrolimnae]|uniref:Uncharacterized protein n=1 Tax=Flavobacterium psychrolimnae TaxID=249351 RepID=A0A366B1U8_9FLAO|nr:hypothetical protein [Flavobacterium psychrolimnae]RBN51095.1 hypothetical protein DR980_04535 [Flavobacterium psychrolimnae]
MFDINLVQIQEICKKSKQSIDLSEFRFPYQESYKSLNQKIIEAAEEGKNLISIDFVYSLTGINKSLTLNEIEKLYYRIYLNQDGGLAEINLYDYPLYLITRGFKVEIIENLKQHLHGYPTKKYMISW